MSIKFIEKIRQSWNTGGYAEMYALKNLLGVLADKLASFFEGHDFSATPPPPYF